MARLWPPRAAPWLLLLLLPLLAWRGLALQAVAAEDQSQGRWPIESPQWVAQHLMKPWTGPICRQRGDAEEPKTKDGRSLLPALDIRERLGVGRKPRSCAVVSNSGMLIDRGLGSFIDSHDLIFRFNFAPTKGYEKDVGSKTHVRFVLGNNVFWEDGDEIIVHRLHGDYRRKRDLRVLESLSNWETNRVYTIRDDFRQWTQMGGLLSSWTSTGYLGVAVALVLCKEVNLFGFQNFTGSLYHYFKDDAARERFRYLHPLPYQEQVPPPDPKHETPDNLNHHMPSEWAVYEALRAFGRLDILPQRTSAPP